MTACIGSGILFVLFCIFLCNQELLFSVLQTHRPKVVKVITNNVFLTGVGAVLISENCCKFVRNQVVWCGAGAVWVGVLLNGGCSGQISFSKENSDSAL